jgi:hypothetical protein
VTDNRSPKERLLDLLNRKGFFLEEDDSEIIDLADLISDIGELLAEKVLAKEPYATETAALLREGGRSISRHLNWLAEEKE